MHFEAFRNEQFILFYLFNYKIKLSKLDEPDMQDTAGEARTSSEVMYSYGPPHMAEQKQDDQLKHTYSSYVRIWDVAPEDLPEAMNDREKWRERIRDSHASSTT